MITSFDPSNFTILMVDDQPKNIQVLGSTLTSQGYEVEYATNGPDALDWMQDMDFDMVLLDVMMPGMDGFEVCKKLRDERKYDDIPIIFLTAKTDKESTVKGFQSGGQDYVTKPFDSNELLVRVKTQLELKESKKKLKESKTWLEKKVAERTKELKAANEKLMAIDDTKSQFLRIISHEIRTPLNGITNSVNFMKEMEMPEESEMFLEILDESSKRLEDFSYKALDISNLNLKGNNLMNFEIIDITSLLETLINKNLRAANNKGLSFNFNNNSNIVTVLADVTYLQKCLQSVIDNAIKFSKENTAIKIEVSKKGENISIVIEDQGEKFPDGFDIKEAGLFYGDNHVDQNPGLSLHLCKLIIEVHNGAINIGNTETGTYVEIEIPHAS